MSTFADNATTAMDTRDGKRMAPTEMTSDGKKSWRDEPGGGDMIMTFRSTRQRMSAAGNGEGSLFSLVTRPSSGTGGQVDVAERDSPPRITKVGREKGTRTRTENQKYRRHIFIIIDIYIYICV